MGQDQESVRSMPSLLVLAFFPAFSPPSSGGEMRLGGLYRALSETHDVTLLTSTDFGARFEEIAHTPRFRELRFPKDEFWRAAYATLERRGLSGELSGLAFALAVSDPACELSRVARELAARSDAVIHEFPYSEPIFADGCPVPEIYNSHNFEAALLGSIVQGPGLDAALLKLMRLEGNLARRARRVFATSTIDAEKFRLFYGVESSRISLCPNGYDESELARVAAARQTRIERPARRPVLLFTGSAHRPNVEAAEWLLEIAPQLAACDLILAGGLCQAIADRKIPDNVIRFGPFDASQKSALLEGADLYLNPVRLGSGTSLKAIEALGANLPMVSTPEGARGLGLIDGVHAAIAERGNFVASIERLLSDAEGRHRLALAGRAFVEATFSWRRIAAKLVRELERPTAAETAAPPLALAFNDYSVLEGSSGGIARIRNLLANLQCDVVLLTFGADFQISLLSPGVLHVTVPKTAPHRSFEAAVNDNQPVSINDGVASLFAGGNRLLLEIAAAIALRAHALIFEHPYMAPVLDALMEIRPDLPVIYSAHNVEARHKDDLLQNHSIGPTFARFIAELENRLVRDARLIVCCTEQDAIHFAPSGVPVALAPNGCSPPRDADRPPEAIALASAGRRPKKAGFLASSHPPNVEAALHIVTRVAPLLPDVQFEFVGGVCDALAKVSPANAILHGVVDEARKSRILAGWDIALNPLQSGGGSSLKLPDYMIHGLATLNTTAGARGFPVVQMRAGRVVELEDFVSNLREMLSDPAKLAPMGANARSYAQNHLAWPAVAGAYRARLRDLFSAPGETRARRKLLIVTYRYTEPSLGGAEEYLMEILKHLRIHFDRIDLAAVDVEQITDRHHFGCQISSATGGGARRLGELFDQSRFFPPEEPDADELIRACRDLERIWGQEELALLSPFAESLSEEGRPRLFSGFFSPEKHEGVTRSWTTPEFSFLLPDDSRIFQLAGYAAVEKSLELTLLEVRANGESRTVARLVQPIPAHFDVSFALPVPRSQAPLILHCKVVEHQAPGDHRPFGVLLEKASVLSEGDGDRIGSASMVALQTMHADLEERLVESLRATRLEKLVESFYTMAQRRDPAADALFAAARGPHSPQMQQWLATHAAGYDTVLVQGIPFDVIPRSVETLSAVPNPPRIVTLPHFHGDDRFYHWRNYYRSFGRADKTLLFSPFIAERLGDPGKFALVPGGGVRLDEYGDADARREFAKIHPRANPFFLVLGRKTASKGYRQAILAHQILRQSRPDVDLVLIGPDDDGDPIEAESVFYLGRQPREAIRGALAACLALVTMSQSESFGIVLAEAWLFGKPVIANRNCYSFRDLVRHCETGFLVGAVQELVAAMHVLADDEKWRGDMGRAGFDDVIGKYGWEQVADAVRAEL
jgi:glycosyltransferase involved in cell wall biosynthesis